MTAFARSEAEGDWGGRRAQLVWELRTVNHRYREIQPRLPEELRSLEPQIRQSVERVLARGKLEAVLHLRGLNQNTDLEIDWQRAANLAGLCKEILTEFDGAVTAAPVTEFVRLPGVLQEPPLESQSLRDKALELLDTALADLVVTRTREGERLVTLLHQRLDATRETIRDLCARREEINQQVRERLEARLDNLPKPPDHGRLEQELVYVAQRQDIDEELERIQAHLDEVERLLGSQEAVGRRLDFLMQELNREANTIASKAADSTTSASAVDLKVWIEQMREQVQNVE
jgi:uncharacterized protein (TIGR00255 family)